MTGHSTAERLRKMATGVCLIVAPVGLALGIWMHPKESMDPAEQLRIIGSDPGRWATAHWILMASAVLMAGVFLGLAHLIHQHRPGHAIVGGTMGLLGAMALTAVTFAEASFGSSMGRIGSDGTLAAFKDATAGPAFLLILVFSLMGPLGLIVLGAGAYRAGVIPSWAALATILGGACVAVSIPSTNLHVLTIAGTVITVVGLAPIGFMVLGETDEEWAHTPPKAPVA